jgi:hypothetical protein
VKSAFDCFQQAAKCEEMAATASDDASRALLLATAGHWRALGKVAKAREQRETNYEPRTKAPPRQGPLRQR